MGISGPVYSRGATSGANTVKAYTKIGNSLGSITTGSLVAGSANPKFTEDEGSRFTVRINVSTGSTVLIAGVPNHKIEVYHYNIVAAGVTTVNFLSGATTISGPINLLANQDLAGDGLITGIGEGLSITLSASTVGGHLSYRLV